MPITRSVSRQVTEEASGLQPGVSAVEATSHPAAEDVVTPSATTVTTESTVTTEPTATTAPTDSEPTVTADRRKKRSSRPPSKAGSTRKRDLARARVELLEKQVELATARIAALEVDSDEDFEGETVREERTQQWVHNNTLALTEKPHTEAPRQEEPVRVDESMKIEAVVSTPNQTIDYNELATAITMAARAIQPVQMQLPRHTQELPMFNGSSSDWLPFKTAYEETAVFYSEAENLSRLRRCLRGAAKETAHCLFVGTTSTAEVLGLLQSRFGRADALVMAEMNKLRALPKLSEHPKDICIFASRIQNVTATVKALSKPHYLYNVEVVRHVIEKMPAVLRYQYYEFNASQDENQPDLITLSKFMEQTASRVGSFAPAEQITSEDRREREPRRPMRTFHIQETPTPPQTPEKCVLCQRSGHLPAECNKMKAAELSARWDLAKSYRLCFRCLKTRSYRHSCKSKQCDIDGCTYTHHQLLHSPTTVKTQIDKPEERSFTVASARETRNTTALLKIVPVQLRGPRGECSAYALLDDGSTCSLIDAALAEQIGADGPAEPLHIEGVAGTRVNADKSKRVEFSIRGRHSKLHNITARTMTNLQLSPQGVSRQVVEACNHLADIEHMLLYEEGTPTILLGQDNWHLLASDELRRGNSRQPVASLTPLGWVLHGLRELKGVHGHRVNHIRVCQEDESMELLMKEHFALESLGIEAKRSYTDDERRAMQILKDNTRRSPSGGYETGLLWKTDAVSPPDNYKSTLTRLEHIERKLDRDDNMKTRYKQQLASLLDNGFAEVAPIEKGPKLWYLPHFAVINPQKPEKLRIVHDAAAKTRGVSLNDMLLSGPDLLQSLPGVLMKYRQRPVAVTADIKDMFLRIAIREEDRDMQRFLWRGDRREGPPTEYRMKSVIFGATSSPCTAIYVKNANAEEHRAEFPEAAAAIIHNHYMDDYLASFDSEEEALRVSKEVAHVHKQASFHLQKWTSNSKNVREQLSPGIHCESICLDKEKILGMVWHPHDDTLSFNINRHKIPEDILVGSKTPSKREALRTVMSLFDPLGIATPVTIQAKRILQETWRSGIDWDTELQPSEAEAWRKWVRSIAELSQLAVPRCYSMMSEAREIQLHTFVDASSSAYAAAVYWRVQDGQGRVHVSLIAGKGRVAPLKLVSIPRLELQAAVLGSRLAHTVIQEHEIQPSKCYYWSDSRTVLAWLRNGPRVYKSFVAHRIAELAENTKLKQWRWVPTSMNVADDATRATPDAFTSDHRWFKGPAFLYQSEDAWPTEEATCLPDTSGEERVHLVSETTRLTEALPDIQKYSNWIRVIRVTARVLQFIDKLRAKQRCAALWKRTRKGPDADPTWTQQQKRSQTKPDAAPVSIRQSILIEARYLHNARQLWVRAVQEDAFKQELAAIKADKDVPSGSRLAHLSLVMNHDGIMCLRSRVAAAEDITAEQREPAVIDGNHRWTRLYIAWVHRQLHHGGFETTANEVRQHYFVLRLRHSVRTEVKSCQVCRLRRAKPALPSTGNHPRSRLAHHQRPFTFTGLDYFGPITVSVGRTRQKRYGVLFTCLTTRAVHLEVAGSLSTDSAIMALRRFIGRRGCPTELWSDQGTNLKGADAELRKAAEEAMQHEASIRFVTWRYIPPSAPFMGGAWERLVRSVKTALEVTLKERAPKEEVLCTLFVEAEYTINSRPLTHLSTEAEDAEALTPNHFLLGNVARIPLPGSFTEADEAGVKQWRVSQRLADMFWARWVREYLPELQHRREPRARGAIQLGDLVLIADGTLPRNMWPRGQVQAVYPGPDGEVRAVDVRTTRGVLRRPTKKLVILPTSAV